MGKTTRWLKRLVAKIRSHPTSKEKRSLVKPPDPGAGRAGNATSSCVSAPAVRLQAPPAEDLGYAVYDAGKHAIAVATASAAAAEAALAAAQAAAAVVRLTASGRCYAAPPVHVILGGARETSAALVIQSHFRGYLARRALRALKGLVKLQALVRGHIMRRKTAETMRSMEAMLRAQARARSMRAYDSPFSSGKSSQFHHPGPSTPEKLEQISYTKITSNTYSPMSKGSGSRSVSRVIIHPDKGYLNSSPGWSDSQLDESNWLTRGRMPHHKSAASCSTEEDYYVKTDKILEVDTGEKNLNQSIQDEDTDDEEENAFCTAENSPQFFAATSRRQSQTTPTKSDTSAASWQSGYSDCPSYMSYTESSRAKMRSLSAPRQRPRQQQLLGNERMGSKKRWSNVHQQNASSAAMQARFASKAYPGSGHLDRLGMPIRNNSAGVYYSGCLN